MICLFLDSREDLEEISERKPDLESLEGNSEVRSNTHLAKVVTLLNMDDDGDDAKFNSC